MLLRTLTLAFCSLCVVQCYDDEYVASTSLSRHKRDLSGKKLKFVFILQEPYTYVKPDGTFEGFIPDLVEALSRQLRFEYTSYLVPDGKYGSVNPDGSWTGMIKEILDHELDESKGADIAAAPLTITSSRLAVVDFIKPFQHTGLALLVKKPYKEGPTNDIIPAVFQVLGPFAAEVWALTIISFFVVAAVLCGMNYINPYEWGPRYQMGRASETQGNLFNLQGSLWFAFSTLQWQGYERAPRSLAARVLSCFWFAYVTLTLVTYAGSLMNQLFWASTVHGKDLRAPPFHTLEELLLNNEYAYGVIKGGSTYNYIMSNTKRLEYAKMAAYFQSAEGKLNLVSYTVEGIERVRKGKFAFLMEDMAARHIINQAPCDLMIAGEKIASRSYGMAVSRRMPNTTSDLLHRAILELHEMGEIEALERKWWIDKGECWSMRNMTLAEMERNKQALLELNKPRKVSIHEFWGPLVIMVVGLITSVLIAIVEIIYYRYKGRYQAENRPGGSPLKLEEDGHNDS